MNHDLDSGCPFPFPFTTNKPIVLFAAWQDWLSCLISLSKIRLYNNEVYDALFTDVIVNEDLEKKKHTHTQNSLLIRPREYTKLIFNASCSRY